MERISVFDIFKIGVGPSSSHTLGPWKAARQFAEPLIDLSVTGIQIDLYGSLSKTGRGHATDIACLLGLEGWDPEYIATDQLPVYVERIRTEKTLKIGRQDVPFDPTTDIEFHLYALPYHPNGMKLTAFLEDDSVIEGTYYSIGGGFIEQEGVIADAKSFYTFPFPIDKGSELLAYCDKENKRISDIVMANELALRSEAEVRRNILRIFDTFIGCIYKGCHTDGILPGGLNVTRRAKKLNEQLMTGKTYTDQQGWLDAVRTSQREFGFINRWVSCFALAVNEENAALGRVVTSPTNGAAGVIPAVLLYYYCFCSEPDEDEVIRFMLTAGEVGSLFKKGATISAAMGGCQAEIGVSSAMAAAGLTELMGGTPAQALMAAEIAMEHHLGLTCDPIGGLVQVPCIERNAMGAVKAITAANLAMGSDPATAIVQFDVIVKTMWETALDMNSKYKETAEGGLAFSLPVIMAEC